MTTQCIPTIYSLSTITSNLITIDTTKLNYDASGMLFSKLKLITSKYTTEYVNILEVVDKHTIRVDKELTEWGRRAISVRTTRSWRQNIRLWTRSERSYFYKQRRDLDHQLKAEKQKVSDLQQVIGTRNHPCLGVSQSDALERAS